MKRIFFFMLLFFVLWAVSAYGQDVAGYRGVPWGSRFPVIEKQFPGVSFV